MALSNVCVKEKDGNVIVVNEERKRELIMSPGITVKDIVDGYDAYNRGALVQDAFRFMTPDEREFLMTGILPEEWEEMFPDDEDLEPLYPDKEA